MKMTDNAEETGVPVSMVVAMGNVTPLLFSRIVNGASGKMMVVEIIVLLQK